MKSLLLALLIPLTSQAFQPQLEATSFQALKQKLEETTFQYRETGKIFGFVSTQSCLFTAPGIIVFKNYCFPARKYPAQGYTIISKQFGMIDLYQEDMSATLLKRDLRIDQFPSIMSQYLDTPAELLGLTGLSSTIEKMHYKYYPACWSTNYSYYTETTDVNCNTKPADVVGFDQWAQETQAFLNDELAWRQFMKEMNAKFKP
jgi:hypothetical protein